MSNTENNFLQSVKLEYEKHMDEEIGDTRSRDNVEHRAALSNSLRPYATTIELGKMWGRDHSTIVHYRREHLPLIQWSPQYRFKYGVALASAQSVAEKMDVDPLYRSDIQLEKQLEHLDDIIDWVSEMRAKVQQKLAKSESRP